MLHSEYNRYIDWYRYHSAHLLNICPKLQRQVAEIKNQYTSHGQGQSTAPPQQVRYLHPTIYPTILHTHTHTHTHTQPALDLSRVQLASSGHPFTTNPTETNTNLIIHRRHSPSHGEVVEVVDEGEASTSDFHMIMETFPRHRETHCAQCGGDLSPSGSQGRPRKYCEGCRPSVWRRRRKGGQQHSGQLEHTEPDNRNLGGDVMWIPLISDGFTVISDDVAVDSDEVM